MPLLPNRSQHLLFTQQNLWFCFQHAVDSFNKDLFGVSFLAMGVGEVLGWTRRCLSVRDIKRPSCKGRAGHSTGAAVACSASRSASQPGRACEERREREAGGPVSIPQAVMLGCKGERGERGRPCRMRAVHAVLTAGGAPSRRGRGFHSNTSLPGTHSCHRPSQQGHLGSI